MVDDQAFAARIRERFPEGLTGVLALGGTRTSFILQQAHELDPGHIRDYTAYVDYSLEQMLKIVKAFLELGGQNVIVAIFSYQGFYERGDEYAALMIEACRRLIDEEVTAFYHVNQLDPYFAGIDTLLHLPAEHPAHALAEAFQQFQTTWDYQPDRGKVIWEIAPIPLFSYAQMQPALAAELSAQLGATTDLQQLHDTLYRFYARAVYGTDLPEPHFYLGTNRNGDLKLRAVLPIALSCGSDMRLYYTPYPSFFVTRETLKAILEDLAFGELLRSKALDYQGQYSAELVQTEYQRIVELSTDPQSVLGLSRQSSGARQD